MSRENVTRLTTGTFTHTSAAHAHTPTHQTLGGDEGLGASWQRACRLRVHAPTGQQPTVMTATCRAKVAISGGRKRRSLLTVCRKPASRPSTAVARATVARAGIHAHAFTYLWSAAAEHHEDFLNGPCKLIHLVQVFLQPIHLSQAGGSRPDHVQFCGSHGGPNNTS